MCYTYQPPPAPPLLSRRMLPDDEKLDFSLAGAQGASRQPAACLATEDWCSLEVGPGCRPYLPDLHSLTQPPSARDSCVRRAWTLAGHCWGRWPARIHALGSGAAHAAPRPDLPHPVPPGPTSDTSGETTPPAPPLCCRAEWRNPLLHRRLQLRAPRRPRHLQMRGGPRVLAVRPMTPTAQDSSRSSRSSNW